MPLIFQRGDRQPTNSQWAGIRRLPDGRIAVFGVDESGPALLSADGTRIDFPGSGEWWERPK
jgi:hypothetical protein